MIRKIAFNQCLIINLEENNAIYHINYNIKKICVYWVAAKVCKYFWRDYLEPTRLGECFILPYFNHVLIANNYLVKIIWQKC